MKVGISAKTLSQQKQIALIDLKEWILKETTSIVEPLRNKGISLLKEIQFRLDDATEVSEKILQNSDSEMQKNNPKTYRFARNANKFAHSFSEAVKAVNVPKEVTFTSIQTLSNDLEKKLATALQLRAEAYPYITPYFIFDRRRLDVSIKRLTDIHQELHNFLTTKYAKAKTTEETSFTIQKLLQAINQADEIVKQLLKMREREKGLRQELTRVQQEIAGIEGRAELKDLEKAEETVRDLREDVKHSLRYLQKPFFKLQTLSRSGGIALPVDEARKLSDYLTDPFEALATEAAGYPMLKSILRKLNQAINQGKLKLKSSRLKKAQEQIDNILNKHALDTLQNNCIEARNNRKQLLSSGAAATVQNELTRLQEQLKQIQKENEQAGSRIKALESEHTKLVDRIVNDKRELEKTVFQLTTKSIQVVLPLSG